MARPRAVILDTDVFSLLYITPRRTHDQVSARADQWRADLAGYRVAISFQTRAEVLAGAYWMGWEPRRQDRALALLDQTPTIETSTDVVEAFARLRAEARRAGLPIAQGTHTADCWIAACAITAGLPLLTGNVKHFLGAPRLTLFTQ